MREQRTLEQRCVCTRRACACDYLTAHNNEARRPSSSESNECAKKDRPPTTSLTACQAYETSNREPEGLRLADGAGHRLATLNGGEAGVDRHVDVLTEELHR